MRCLSVVLLLASATTTAAAPAPPLTPPAAPDPPTTAAPAAPPSSSATMAGLLGAALTATDDERYCEALYLFEALHLRQPTPRALYNAAEVAFAAGDRVKALDLYRGTQRLYPDFDKKELIQRRADAVFAAMVKAGPGTACPVRADVCGDWMLLPTENGERCDDGNTQDGDGCDHDCSVTACGNGVVTAGEGCDDGNDRDGDGCDRGCVATGCGNGVVTGEEVCDDGNDNDGDGCDRGCLPTGCGNGVVTAPEECDDRNDVDGDGCDRGCQVSRCGNAIVTGLEQCDDGNDVSGDGCEVDCSRTRVKRPLPGIVIALLGGAGLVGGGALLAVGTGPFLAHEVANAELTAAERRYSSDPAGALDAAEDAQLRAENASAAAASWGTPTLVAGSALVLGGAIGAGVGIWMALTDTELAGGLQ